VIEPTRYVGNSDFHDGHILAVVKQADSFTVTVKGGSGKHYTVTFEGVASMQSDSSEGMMLYGLRESETATASLHRYAFVNWYVDEPNTEESKSRLEEILAEGFTESR
jgi:hypothetical protein